MRRRICSFVLMLVLILTILPLPQAQALMVAVKLQIAIHVVDPARVFVKQEDLLSINLYICITTIGRIGAKQLGFTKYVNYERI